MRAYTEADIERIRAMEAAFDDVRCALGDGVRDAQFLENIRLLESYVSSGQWMRDYESDEQGLLPGSLKRGVLSQDALYNLLRRIDQGGETA